MRRALALLVLGPAAGVRQSAVPVSDRARFWLVVLAIIAGAVVFWTCTGVGLAKTGWH